jgi:hypothetical protein
MRKRIWEGLGLSEDATVAEARAAFDRVLEEAMTPEEKEEEAKRRREEEEQELAREVLGQVYQALGLSRTVSGPDVLAAIEALRAKGKEGVQMTEAQAQDLRALKEKNATLEIELARLSEQVKELAPRAAQVEQLLKERAETEKRVFFETQLREGKLAPAERAKWEELYDLAPDKVRAFFADRKKGSVIHLGETGTVGVPELSEEERDPREVLAELAERRAREKGIGLVEALEQVRTEREDLVRRVAGMYGPASAHAPRR